MTLVVFEDHGFENLLPLVYSRATFNLRIGFDNLLAKIEAAFGKTAGALFVRESIADAIGERQSREPSPRAVNKTPAGEDQWWINGRLLLRQKPDMPVNSAAWDGETLLAARIDRATAIRLDSGTLKSFLPLQEILKDCKPAALPASSYARIDYPWQAVHLCAAEIERQFKSVQPGINGTLYGGAHIVNEKAVFVGTGSVIKPCAVLDAEEGPIYIGKNVRIQPNVTVAGPCYIGDGCIIQPGASIRSGTSIGMMCKVGGEVEGSIFHGYSNKQHDGFLGHSYVGEWANLGADTVTSDLKNTYGPVSVPVNGRMIDSGEMFVGTIFGDHVKTGINTTLQTGTVLGFAANVFTSRHPPKFVPSFTWLTDEGAAAHDPKRAVEVARKVFARRKRELTPAEEKLFLSIPEEARRYEK